MFWSSTSYCGSCWGAVERQAYLYAGVAARLQFCRLDICSSFRFGVSVTMHLPTSLLLSGAITLGFAAAERSAGCGKSLPEAITLGKTHMANFTSDGTVRSYRIHLPSNYDDNNAVPVIFSFHGRSKTAKGQEDLSQFSNEKWNPNAIAIYPQGIDVRMLLFFEGSRGVNAGTMR